MSQPVSRKPFILPPVWALIFAFLMKLCQIYLPSLGFACPGPYHRHLSLALALAGITVALLAIAAFRQARTTTNPMKPRDSSSLVVSGIYCYTRNPMYLGLLFVLSGWCLFLQNIAAMALLPLFLKAMNYFQISIEEECLEAKFGEEYLAYKNRVPRWLLMI